jgi:two-component system nitrogen regulation response regulator GlnG
MFAFPGNVRQLENICHWLTVMAPSQVIEPKDLPPEIHGTKPVLSRSVSAMSSPAAASALFEPSLVSHSPSASAALPTASANEPQAAPQPLTADAESASTTPLGSPLGWEAGMQVEAMALLESGHTDVWEILTRRFESSLIQTALQNTRGRRIEAAQKLGIGRNTITRKIQELNLE